MSERDCHSVTFIQRGRSFSGPWRKGDTLLQAALGMGVLPRYSCMSGECGACMAKVAEGTVRMQDNWSLSEAEVAMGYVLLCQSFPTSAAVSLELQD